MLLNVGPQNIWIAGWKSQFLSHTHTESSSLLPYFSLTKRLKGSWHENIHFPIVTSSKTVCLQHQKSFRCCYLWEKKKKSRAFYTFLGWWGTKRKPSWQTQHILRADALQLNLKYKSVIGCSLEVTPKALKLNHKQDRCWLLFFTSYYSNRGIQWKVAIFGNKLSCWEFDEKINFTIISQYGARR